MNQSFEDWQQSPIQGVQPLPLGIQEHLDLRCPCYAKPLAECDCQTDPNPELLEIGESFKSAAPWLEKAYNLMGSNHMDKRYERLYMAVCDAMSACSEALERLDDEPDEE